MHAWNAYSSLCGLLLLKPPWSIGLATSGCGQFVPARCQRHLKVSSLSNVVYLFRVTCYHYKSNSSKHDFYYRGREGTCSFLITSVMTEKKQCLVKVFLYTLNMCTPSGMLITRKSRSALIVFWICRKNATWTCWPMIWKWDWHKRCQHVAFNCLLAGSFL